MGDYINSFAFVDDDGQVTLVDCGLKKAPPRILEGLAGIGKRPSDVTRIILTHAHGDHAGGAKEMLDASPATGVEIHDVASTLMPMPMIAADNNDASAVYTRM